MFKVVGAFIAVMALLIVADTVSGGAVMVILDGLR